MFGSNRDNAYMAFYDDNSWNASIKTSYRIDNIVRDKLETELIEEIILGFWGTTVVCTQ